MSNQKKIKIEDGKFIQVTFHYAVLDVVSPIPKFNNFVLIIIKNQNNISIKNSSDLKKNNNILRYYGIGAQIIKDLEIKNMILVTRSKKKIIGLDGYGIKIKKQEIIK